MGSYALVVASARTGRIARLPSPTPVTPTPAIAISGRNDYGSRGVHTWTVSKGRTAHAEPATATLASKSPITSLVIDFIALDLLLYQTRDTGRVFARLLGLPVLAPDGG